MINQFSAARLIDISAVRTQHSLQDIVELVHLAKQYHFINVHVLPIWVKTLRKYLNGISDVYVGAPVGFPSGGHKTLTKLVEAQQLLQDGVQEMDIVMNISRFKNKEYRFVADELEAIIRLSKTQAVTKVIIEINALSNDEMLHACEIVAHSGADFVKTGTGWIPGSANLERISLIKSHFGKDLKVKAAGGIRTREDFLTLVDMGVERMGINTCSAVEIVKSLPR